MTSKPYTETQMKIMAILPMISSPLSIIGSSLIVNKILSDRKRKLAQMYNRILLGFSICDIISSSAMCFSTLPSPSDTPDLWGARGNNTTCVIQGFFLQAGFSVIYYNSLLVLYYLLSIRYGVSELTFRKYLEPWVHIFIIFMAVVPSLLGIFLGMYNNVGNVCFVGEYPKGCSLSNEIECERGEMAYLFIWLTSGWLVAFLFITLPINLIVLWCSLAEKEQKITSLTNPTFELEIKRKRKSKRNTVEALRQSRPRRRRTSSYNNARTQAIYYIASSFLCLSFPIIIIIINKPGGLFIIRSLGQFFYPLQGFFNFFNYTRPRVLKLRQKKLANTFFHALYLATFESDENLKRLRLQRQIVEQSQRKRERRRLEVQMQNQDYFLNEVQSIEQ